MNEKKFLESKLKEDSEKAYSDWLAQKGLRDTAVRCLQHIPKAEVSPSGPDIYD